MAASRRAHRLRLALALIGLLAVGTAAGRDPSGAGGPAQKLVVDDDFERGQRRGLYLRPCSVEVVDGLGLAHGSGRCFYPQVIGDAHLSFMLRPGVGREGSYGAIVMADTGIDRIMDFYVEVWVIPGANVVRVEPWNRGRTAPFEAPIPREAGFAGGQWNRVEVIIANGTLTVVLNGVEVAKWEGPAPALRGYVGWILDSVPETEPARIDDFTVVSHGYHFPGAPPLLLQISLI